MILFILDFEFDSIRFDWQIEKKMLLSWQGTEKQELNITSKGALKHNSSA